MRVVLLSPGAAAPPEWIVEDLHYAAPPGTMARIRTDVRNVLSRHGLGNGDPDLPDRGFLRITSGPEPPGVHVLTDGGGGGGGGGVRVMLSRPVVWQRRADGAERLGAEVEEAARMGDWLVFELCLPMTPPQQQGQ
ncbi:fructose-2,6-bisphosphatase [Cordyceps fumosorosea ARSEF 2679]|uniref:Fructose-2,6-bisphosphatase n=1 Tax=Cordyceps fumosorosea (strain ARSEF 2679) TaxID=1081104 RepID=A0A167WN75_CORFA|nr:fructose-2,6-bisphosphatase [Cordyceps fumosorosea ARSEF 2679]OAA64001.1 fructose-2,6-bisphosphatase [Cordyceps fumosorosea ARSEF 2679]